jgi:hypothetical protein
MEQFSVKSRIAAALIFSVLVHLFFVLTISIVTPDDILGREPFTRVTFLGPILEKKAFDIMVGDQEAAGFGRDLLASGFLTGKDSLERPPDTVLDTENFSVKAGREMYKWVRPFLPSEKISPGDTFRGGYGDMAKGDTGGIYFDAGVREGGYSHLSGGGSPGYGEDL